MAENWAKNNKQTNNGNEKGKCNKAARNDGNSVVCGMRPGGGEASRRPASLMDAAAAPGSAGPALHILFPPATPTPEVQEILSQTK